MSFSGAVESVTRGVTPTFKDPEEQVKVFDFRTWSEHLKDQAFDSTQNGGTFHIIEFIRTQVIAVFAGELTACCVFSAITTIAFAMIYGVATTLPGNLITVSLASYFAMYLVVSQFGHVSGAHLNPMTSTVLFFMHVFHYVWNGGLWLILRDLVLLLTYWAAQISGWFIGVSIAWYIVNDSAATSNLGLPFLGVVDGEQVPEGRAFFIEFFAAFVYLGVYAFVVVDRNMKEAGAASAMANTIGALTIVFAGLTGCNLNMFRWITVYAITGSPTSESWWVYIFPSWVAAFGVLIAVELWRRLIERTTDGKISMQTSPEMPPKNKYHTDAQLDSFFKTGKKEYVASAIKDKALKNKRFIEEKRHYAPPSQTLQKRSNW